MQRRRNTTQGYAACLALALAVTIAGCSKSTPDQASTSSAATSDATTATTSSATPTTTSAAPTGGTTTAATDPNIPEAARANTPAGAEDFAMYFGKTVNQAFAGLNKDEISRLSLSSCQTCSGMMSAIDEFQNAKQRFVGDYANFIQSTWASDIAGVTKVLVVTKQNEAKVLDAAGGTVREIPPSRGNLSVQLKFDGQWRVAEIQGAA